MTQLILSVFYFFTLALIGLEIAYLPLYAKSLGCSDMQVSILISAAFIGNALFIIPWSFISDRIKKVKMMVVIGGSLACASTILLVFIKKPSAFIAAFYLFAILQAIIYPQVEALTLASSHREGFKYGKIRAIGSLGFVITSYIFGLFINLSSLNLVPYLFIGVAIIQLLAIFKLPHPPIEHPEKPRVSELLDILKKKQVVIFVVTCLLWQISHGLYYAFFSIWLSRNGYSPATIGLLWSLAILAEVISLWKSHIILEKIGTNLLLGISIFGTGLRWLIYFSSPMLWVILVGQCLNSLSFGTFHLSSMHYVMEHMPKHLRQTGIAIYTAASFGFGAAIGTLCAGVLVPLKGITPLFLWCSLIAFAGALIFGVSLRAKAKQSPKTSS